MFANTCRHRGHELLPEDGTSTKRAVSCPYHAWTYDLSGRLKGAPGFRDVASFDDRPEHALVELPLEVWHGWAFGHALHPLGAGQVPPFERYVGELARMLAPYDIGSLVVADRHSYEVAANWKVIAENYHECYHCPLIHPELCQVTPPDSGDNYDLPGAWIGGGMVLRDGMASMSLDGSLAATPLPGVEPDRGGVPPPAAQPAGLRAPRLRDDPPDGAAGAGPDLGRVLVADAARVRRVRARDRCAGRGGVLGHHQPAGLGRLRVGPARAPVAALPARAVRAQGGRGRAAGVDDRRGLPLGRAVGVTPTGRARCVATALRRRHCVGRALPRCAAIRPPGRRPGEVASAR